MVIVRLLLLDHDGREVDEPHALREDRLPDRVGGHRRSAGA